MRPPASSAPRCDDASMPYAAPLTTQTPALPSRRPRSRAISPPSDEHRRAPTIATRTSSTSRRAPRTYSATGGSSSCRHDDGYSASPGVRNRASTASAAAMTASASTSARCCRSPSLPARPARIAATAREAPSSCQHRRWSVAWRDPPERRQQHDRRVAPRDQRRTPVGHPVGANASSTGSSKRLLTEPFPVRQRLRQMLDIDVSRSREVGHGPGDLQRAVESTSGERERVHGRRQESLGVGGQVRVTPDERSGQMCVARDADPRVPDTLSFARRPDADGGRRRSALLAPTPTAPAW